MGTDQRVKVSVVMPVHNAAPFLDESISSILNQSLAEFEFVILDDGSTDGSREILHGWQQRDDRIRLFAEDQSLGLSGSSNFVVSKTSAPLVARMDADDVSHPDRLLKQWKVMQTQPNVVALGTLCDGIDAKGDFTRPRDRWRLVRRSPYIPFPHGSAMFRRAVFDAVGGYREECAGREDQDLFFRMRDLGRVVTLSDVLYRFRYHSFNSSRQLGAQDVSDRVERNGTNGQDLAALYLVGAMRLWAGERPEVFQHMIAKKSWHQNVGTLTAALALSTWGNISPATLRHVLRFFIRMRDSLAGIVIKDGRAHEWRLK